MPTPPSVGPAGSVVVDPDFNGKILRVTDGTTFVGGSIVSDGSFHTPAGGFENSFSSDGTHFFIGAAPGGTILFSFDEATFSLPLARLDSIRDHCQTIPVGGPQFSYTSPTILYGSYTRQGDQTELDCFLRHRHPSRYGTL
jgi:hypothetical protein